MPVGFKYIGTKMMETDAILGGEESGGYAFRGHIPERDGILSGLMMAAMIVDYGLPLSGILAHLEDLVGPHAYDRHDIRFPRDGYEERKEQIYARMQQNEPDNLAGSKVVRTRDRRRLQVLPGRRLVGAHAHERHRAADARVRGGDHSRARRAAHRRSREPERCQRARRSRSQRMTEIADASGSDQRRGSGRVEKPWGYELRWAVTDRYLGKLIHVDQGHPLSLQYHVQKDECDLRASRA